MNITLTAEDLIKFEDDVCAAFAEKKICAPIHLDNGNEEQLIKVFRDIVEEEDWVCGSWRQHYRALLKGVPRRELVKAVLEGKSISLCFPRYRVISSAIVGGIIPIAVGIAMGIMRRKESHKVVCFMGEMTSESGIAHECVKYSLNHDLPVIFIVEDNGKSVCTPTLDVWQQGKLTFGSNILLEEKEVYQINPKVYYYQYQSKYPHAGGLSRVQF